MTPNGALGAEVDPSRLADGSHTAKALTALGANGERALAHLRTAAQMLQEPERWPRPFETVQASCRSALDALLKEAGEDFEGPLDAQKQVNNEVAGLLKQAGKQGQTPLGKLLTALDAADVPDALEPKVGLGAQVERLIRIPKGRLPVLPHSNSSASVFHSNGGEGVETREKAIALAKMDATRQNRVRNLAAAYPPLTGPLPTTLEPVVQELEPGYERVVHFGREFRLIHQGGRGFQITTGAGKLLCGVAALLTRESALSNIESFGFRSLPHEALRFVRWNDETRVHCVMCEAGFAWGREKSRKAVVDVAGAGAVFVCDGAFHLRTLGLEIPCEAIPEAPGEDLQTRSSTKAPKEKGPRGAEQVELHGHTHAVTMLAGSTP